MISSVDSCSRRSGNPSRGGPQLLINEEEEEEEADGERGPRDRGCSPTRYLEVVKELVYMLAAAAGQCLLVL